MILESINLIKDHPRIPAGSGGELILKDRSLLSVTVIATDPTREFVQITESAELPPGADEPKILAGILRRLATKMTKKDES